MKTVCRSVLRYAASVLAVCLATAVVAYAGEAYVGYDEFGRISRSIDEQNRVTDYQYDEAGNITGIRTTVPGSAPIVTSITPNSLRRGTSQLIQVLGQNLLSTQVQTSDPRLRISGLQNLQNTDTQMTFTLTAESDAVLGAQELTFSNSGGSSVSLVTVNPVLPTASVMPGPIAVPPDSAPRHFKIRLSHADTVPHDFSFSVADGTVASVPASVTIPAGDLETAVPVAGLKLGQTTLAFASSEILAQTLQLYVTNDYQEAYKAYTRPVGVVLQELPAPPQTINFTPNAAPAVGVIIPVSPPAPTSDSIFMASPALGLTLGNNVTGLVPAQASAGTTFSLTIYGTSLQSATTVEFVPGTGVTMDAPVVAADGNSLTVNVTLESTAPQTQREVRVVADGLQVPSSDGWEMLFRVAP